MSGRDISEKGLAEIIGHEGIIQTRYRNGSEKWLIGVRHSAAEGDPDPEQYDGEMPLPEVVALLRRDLAGVVEQVNAVVRVEVAEHEFDALVSFHFDTRAIGRAGLVASLNSGNRGRAARELLDWRRPPEVIRRRTKEHRLFADGVYSNGGQATVYLADPSGRVRWGQSHQVDLSEFL